jgi:hypothetical protein
MRGDQGLLSAGNVAPVKSDPPQLVQRPPEFASKVWPQLLAGHQGLTLRLGARSAQPQNLRAVDAAATPEAPNGIRFAPPLHRLGPLLGDLVLSYALQGAHEFAVDDPSGEGIELPGQHRHAGLVEQHQTLPDIAVQDEQAGFCHPPDGAGSRVALGTDLDCSAGPRPSARGVPCQHSLKGAHDREPRVRRRRALPIEKLLGSRQPPANRCHEGSVEEQVHCDTNGSTGCRVRVTGLQARGVGSLPCFDRHV